MRLIFTAWLIAALYLTVQGFVVLSRLDAQRHDVTSLECGQWGKKW